MFVFAGIALASFLLGVLWGAGGTTEIDALSPTEAEAASIFGNNLLVGVSIVFLGSVTGGVYGCVVLLVNGYLLGELLQYLFAEKMYQAMVTGLLPHLGLEVVGLIGFVMLSFLPVGELVCWMKNGRMSMRLSALAKRAALLFGFGMVSLLLAAIVEGNVSMVI